MCLTTPSSPTSSQSRSNHNHLATIFLNNSIFSTSLPVPYKDLTRPPWRDCRQCCSLEFFSGFGSPYRLRCHFWAIAQARTALLEMSMKSPPRRRKLPPHSLPSESCWSVCGTEPPSQHCTTASGAGTKRSYFLYEDCTCDRSGGQPDARRKNR